MVLCAICLGAFREAVVGPCGHSFCSICVAAPPVRACPLCRTPVEHWVPNYALREGAAAADAAQPPRLLPPVPACPLLRLELNLSYRAGYQRVLARGLQPRELWCFLMLIQSTPPHAPLALPAGVTHVRALRCERMELALPEEESLRLFVFKLRGEHHVLVMHAAPRFERAVLYQWQQETRAGRRRCRRGSTVGKSTASERAAPAMEE